MIPSSSSLSRPQPETDSNPLLSFRLRSPPMCDHSWFFTARPRLRLPTSRSPHQLRHLMLAPSPISSRYHLPATSATSPSSSFSSINLDPIDKPQRCPGSAPLRAPPECLLSADLPTKLLIDTPPASASSSLPQLSSNIINRASTFNCLLNSPPTSSTELRHRQPLKLQLQ